MKKYLLILSTVLASHALFAQAYWNVTYNMALPFGASQEQADKMSFRGFGLDGRSFIDDNITLGGSWSWNVFYERRDKQYLTSESTTVYGNQFRYTNAMPFMFTGHYYFGEDGGTRPYIGTGLGTIWKEDRIDVGTLSTQNSGWQFGLTPEVGIYLPVGTTAFIFVNAKYTQGFQTGKIDATSYLSFGIGIGWENF